jgi:ferredoxin-nitrate reductase
MSDRIHDIWGERTPMARGGSWPERVDVALAEGVTEADVETWVQSACVLCSNGCGCDIAVKDGHMVGVRGRADDAVNRGRLGPKGLFASWQGMDHADRLTTPLIRQSGRLVETDWDTAMDRVVERSRSLLSELGPLSHGFYTSGQLFLEEYYALCVLGKAGIGTPHMDGNTRLCTATAATSLKETFGCDGQPGCYADLDETDAVFLFGHNMAETQTVLWSRLLDRLEGPDRPLLVCVDPRATEVARCADVHLAVRAGTNQALMNGLVRELIAHGWVDEEYVDMYTTGFAELKATVETYTPTRVAEICDVGAQDVVRAAEIFGTSQRVVSTVLQGFYQSHQATAAACMVNNLHLMRGMLGRPGCAVLQMNGQPTAQNNRECGGDGDLPGFRNWENPGHIEELARLWNVDARVIPDWAPPTHAMQIFRYAEQGSIKFLWISATNPAVSLPQLGRIREVLGGDTFLVVQDLYLTETAAYADVVLPAAGWGEKTGTFTNADRTVHISERAVNPPGKARSDLDIFLDYARRMGFEDRDGQPLLPWSSPEEVFDAWRECSRGRPCDYSALSYATLRQSNGVQWPVTEQSPNGTPRLYSDAAFPSEPDYAETFGHDLLTGATVGEQAYRAMAPDGRAILKSAAWTPAHEAPDEDFAFQLSTGRTVYQFHTRTKTARAPKLDAAAPEVWAELAEIDAEKLRLGPGDRVRVVSRRGQLTANVRIGNVREGEVFVPFHYGWWSEAGETVPSERHAANELTMTEWDPVSKQPVFKVAAVRLERVDEAVGGAT